MKKDQKDVNGGTDDISGVARIWCEGTKRGVDCEDRDHWRTYGKLVRPWPLNFSRNFFQRMSKDNTGTLLKYIQFQNLIYHFPEREEEKEEEEGEFLSSN